MSSNFWLKKLVLILAMITLLGGGFYAGQKYEKVFAEKQLAAEDEIATEIINRGGRQPLTVNFDLFWEVLKQLEERFVDQNKLADKKELVYGAIEGMVDSLDDPYTVFLRPEESKKFAEQINGSFGGVGIEIGIRQNLLTVITPIKDTPAYLAGLKAGDIITRIDGEDAADLTVEEAVTKIRGKKGTVVILTIQREGREEPQEFSIVRDEIKIPVIDWQLISDASGQKKIAHLQLFVFNRNVDAQFQKTAKEILLSEAEKIVLDLRNNPGGLLDSAVNIASWFLDPDLAVVRERFADGSETVLKTSKIAELKKYPLIILVNEGSASASEIVAGALRDQRGVKIVGEKTFGKGSVQEVVDLINDTKKPSLKVTVAKWHTPNGLSISDEGINPDFIIKRSEEDLKSNLDPQLEKAVELLSQ